MKLTVIKLKQAVIIELSGRLDSVTAPAFEQDIEACITPPANNLVLDCAELDYISSAGLRVILNTAKAFKDIPWTFAACRMQDHVREVFEISGFDNFITICDSVAECVGNQGE